MPKQMFIINNINFMLKVWDLAKSRGKKAGDSVEEEFQEMLKLDPEAVTYLGKTESDIDMLSGEMRDKGVKVFNLNEFERQNQCSLCAGTGNTTDGSGDACPKCNGTGRIQSK